MYERPVGGVRTPSSGEPPEPRADRAKAKNKTPDFKTSLRAKVPGTAKILSEKITQNPNLRKENDETSKLLRFLKSKKKHAKCQFTPNYIWQKNSIRPPKTRALPGRFQQRTRGLIRGV